LPQLASSDNKTVMTDLNGSGLIQQGVIKPLITAKALCTEFKIQGDYDLPASKVDMQTGITFPSSDKTEACTEINPRLKDIAWPVICRGSVADAPAKLCRADTEKMQSILAKAATKEAGEKLEKKLDEKLKKKFGAESDQIKDAFKGLLR